MPKQQILPTWLALNNANFPTSSGMQDPRTGQDFSVGGLKVGDYFDLTEQEANNLSKPSIGLLHWGRYRLVKVDSGANPAAVNTGAMGLIRIGTFVQSVVINAPGSGGTPGTYTVPVPVNLAGGNGAILQVTVGAAGTVTGASVLQRGTGYIGNQTALIFTVTGILGLTGAILALQLNTTPNVVLDNFNSSVQFATGGVRNWPSRAVVFLNSITPGNYGFVQELGLATVTCNQAVPALSLLFPTGTGVAPQPSVIGTVVGQAVEQTTAASQLLKMYMEYSPVCQD